MLNPKLQPATIDTSPIYNPKLFKLEKKSRMYHFVMTPYAPKIQGNLEVKDDSDSLIEMGLSTIKTLKNMNKPASVCPTLIFPVPADFTESTYDVNRLINYSDVIAAEMQHPIHFHIAGHGDPNSIGSLIDQLRVAPVQFAENVDKLFLSYDMQMLKLRPLVFVFHTCNSAWAPVDAEMSESNMKKCILDHSFIGVFAKEFHNLGYTQISVRGYRGFYSHTTSHKGSIVSRSSALNRNNNDGRPASATEIDICIETGSPPQVKLPLAKADRFFPVKLDEIMMKAGGNQEKDDQEETTPSKVRPGIFQQKPPLCIQNNSMNTPPVAGL